MERGLALMERTSHGFFVNGACVSCHLYWSAGPMLLERVDGGAAPLAQLYALTALAAAGYRPDRMTDAMIANVIAQQLRDGRWQYVQMVPGRRSRTVISAVPRSASAQRARNWLLRAVPLTADDRNMQLLGLH